MSGFGAYTQNYDTKLMQRPFYRKVGGQDPIQSFVQKSGMNYLRNAERIRDMRFARSNEFNADTAIRAEREDLISKTFYENKGKTDLSGLRSRLGLQLSRTGGALSSMQNKVVGSVNPKKNKKKRKKPQPQPTPSPSSSPRGSPPPPPPSSSPGGSPQPPPGTMSGDSIFETPRQPEKYPKGKGSSASRGGRGGRGQGGKESAKKSGRANKGAGGGNRLGGGTPKSDLEPYRYSGASALLRQRKKGGTPKGMSGILAANVASKILYISL